MYYKSKNYQKAIECFKKILELNPNDRIASRKLFFAQRNLDRPKLLKPFKLGYEKKQQNKKSIQIKEEPKFETVKIKIKSK